MTSGFLPWLLRLASNTVFVLRGGHSHGRLRFLRTYVRIELKRMAARVLPYKPTSEHLFGATMEFFDYETFAVLFEEIYVGEMYRFSSPVEDPVILDCGANIGMAVLYFKTLFPRAHITAFEADPVTYAVLARNIERNAWRDVIARNVAVSGARGTVTLFTGEQRGGLSHGIVASPFVPTEGATVEAEPLSDAITGPVHLLKMDVEGSEDDVLAELSETGALAHVDQVVLEYHLHIDPDVDRFGAFLSLLERGGFGYQIRGNLALPFRRREFQCLILYAYRKAVAPSPVPLS